MQHNLRLFKLSDFHSLNVSYSLWWYIYEILDLKDSQKTVFWLRLRLIQLIHSEILTQFCEVDAHLTYASSLSNETVGAYSVCLKGYTNEVWTISEPFKTGKKMPLQFSTGCQVRVTLFLCTLSYWVLIVQNLTYHCLCRTNTYSKKKNSGYVIELRLTLKLTRFLHLSLWPSVPYDLPALHESFLNWWLHSMNQWTF